MKARYAIYYVPERQSPLSIQGAALLGRDIHTGQACDSFHAHKFLSESIACINKEYEKTCLKKLTNEARRYGLHATVKAPFYLAKGYSEAELIKALDNFAKDEKAFVLPRLHLCRIGSFFALALKEDGENEKTKKMHELAAKCVQVFDNFRAPASTEELARRRQKTLSQRQEGYLLRYGYPYVLDEFRFHITLCHLSKEALFDESLEKALAKFIEPCLGGNIFGALALCRSDEEGEFRLLHTAKFGARLGVRDF